jgi:hypothetical protein
LQPFFCSFTSAPLLLRLLASARKPHRHSSPTVSELATVSGLQTSLLLKLL